MGKELQLRQGNFASFSVSKILLNPHLESEEAREILGAACSVMEDKTKVWYVKMPDFRQATERTPDMITPALHWLDEGEADLNDYLKDPTNPVLCVPGPDDHAYWQIKFQSRESMYGEPGSTRNYWWLSMHSQRLTLGMKMHSTAAFLSMPNAEGIVLGGTTDRGFNDNSARGYPAWLTLTTRQVANKYLYGYPDFKVIDPIKEHYPACTMPLAATSPAVVTPEILSNPQYVQDYVAHVALIREMLGQSSLSVNPAVLELCSNKLLQGVSGLLTGASNCHHTREPIPAWNVIKVVRTKPTAELVGSTISLMIHDEEAHLNMPCAPMPIPDTDDTSLMHPALVTELTMSKPYYRQGGLIPHLSRKGFFWKSTRSAIHETVLQ